MILRRSSFAQDSAKKVKENGSETCSRGFAERRIELGKAGEDRAVVYLKKRGYRILERNFRNKLGEIDIVGLESGVICFVEVRTRRDVTSPSLAFESVGVLKQRQLSRLAVSFLKEYKMWDKKARFDVVSVSVSGGAEEVVLLKDAFPVIEKYSY